MDIDLTFLLQLGIFIIVLLGLNPLLFKPFQKVIEDRDLKIAGANAEADRLNLLAEGDLEKYSGQIDRARKEAYREREALRGAGREEERRIVTEARAEVSQTLAEAREQINSAASDAGDQLASETDALAELVAEKILGRKLA